MISKVKIIIKIQAYMFLLIFIIACNGEKEVWNELKTKNDLSAFINYLEEYPDGRYRDSVKTKIEELRYLNAINFDNFPDYNEFLKIYPQSSYSNNISKRIENLIEKREPLLKNVEKVLIKIDENYNISSSPFQLKPIIKRQMIYAGVQVSDSVHDFTFSINITGKSLKYHYVGDIGGYHYTGANLNGKIEIFKGSFRRSETFKADVQPPNVINKEFKEPNAVALIEAFGNLNFEEQLLSFMNTYFGSHILIASLKDPNTEIRSSAAKLIGEIKEYKAIPMLKNILLNESDKDIVGHIATSLGQLNDTSSILILLDIVKNYRMDNARPKAISSIESMKVQSSIKPLINTYINTDMEGVISPEDFEKMLYLIDSQWNERKGIITMIPQIIHSLSGAKSSRYTRIRWILQIIGNPTIDVALKLLHDKNMHYRRAALMVLGDVNDERVLIPVLSILQNDKENKVRSRAAYTLGKVGNKDAVPSLIEALSDKDVTIRYKAATSLGELKDERAVNPLIYALFDENINVREYAAEALGELKNPQAVTPLLDLMQSDSEKSVRDAAWYSLYNFSDKESISKMIEVLENSNSDILFRRCVVQVLQKLTLQKFDLDYAKWSEWFQKSNRLIPN
jgi:HEAT repeat protein